METNTCVKKSFSVIGKKGSTNEGKGFIQKLWNDANSNFHEIESLAKRDNNGNLMGIWGLMSDFSLSFNPWEENFTKGLYLAGIEVKDDAEPPEGWCKWTVPPYEFLYVKFENQNTFSEVLLHLEKNNLELKGAVHDYNCPRSGQQYMYFPIQKL